MPVRRAWLVVGLLGLACERAGEHESSPRNRTHAEIGEHGVEAAELEVGLVGCDAVFADPLCLRETSKPFAIWLPGQSGIDEFELSIEGRSLAHTSLVETSADELGVLMRVSELPPRATLTLDRNGERVATLRLDRMPAQYLDLLAQAKADRQAVRAPLAEARARVAGRPAFLLDCLRAKIDYGEASAQIVSDAPNRLRSNASVVGDRRCIAELQLQAASLLLDADLDVAAEHIRAARDYGRQVPDIAVNADLLDAQLAQRIGQVEQSLVLLERAWNLARRLRLPELYSTTVVTRAIALTNIGRFDEAEQLGREAIVNSRGQREALKVRNNVAWVRVLHREDDLRAVDPILELRALVDEDPRNTTWLNLAIASSRDGLLDEAARALQAIDVERLGNRDRVWFEIVSARIEMGKRPRAVASARGHLDQARQIADLGREPDSQLRVRLERARMEFELGELAAARREFEDAERMADVIALSIDGATGRSSFASSRSESRGRHVELLLRLDDRPAALCVVLGGRARHLRALAAGSGDLDHLDAATRKRYRDLLGDYHARKRAMGQRVRESWRLSLAERDELVNELAGEAKALDQLLHDARRLVEQDRPQWSCERVRPREPEQALLTMIADADGRGWYFFLDVGGRVEVVHVWPTEGETSAALAARALAELIGRSSEFEILTVVATGEFVGLDFQSEVGDDVRVIHGMGLGSSSTGQPWRGEVALHAGTGGLAHTEREISAVAAILEAAGWRVVDWSPTSSSQPDLLHFAGHGERFGTTGWDSALRLAGDERLTSGELIAGRRSPRLVVLGACAAGMTSPEMIDGGMNMAVAFLLAGAEIVIAPDREVEDEVAVELAAMLYEGAPDPEHAGELGEHLMKRLVAVNAADARFRSWRIWIR
ncbi:CHAT domain-containing protein [Nannocystaceae bacterium ST9]